MLSSSATATYFVTFCFQLFVQQFRLFDVKKKCIYWKFQREEEISLSRYIEQNQFLVAKSLFYQHFSFIFLFFILFKEGDDHINTPKLDMLFPTSPILYKTPTGISTPLANPWLLCLKEKCGYDDHLTNDLLRNRASLFPLAISDRVIIKVYYLIAKAFASRVVLEKITVLSSLSQYQATGT